MWSSVVSLAIGAAVGILIVLSGVFTEDYFDFSRNKGFYDKDIDNGS